MTTLSHSVEATVNVPHILPHKGRLCSICKLMFVLSLWAGEPLTQSVCVWRPGTQNNRLCFSRIPTAQKYTLHTPPHTCCNVWVYALRKLTWKNVHLSLFLGLNFRHHTLIVRHNIQSVPPKSLWERMSGHEFLQFRFGIISSTYTQYTKIIHTNSSTRPWWTIPSHARMVHVLLSGPSQFDLKKKKKRKILHLLVWHNLMMT